MGLPEARFVIGLFTSVLSSVSFARLAPSPATPDHFVASKVTRVLQDLKGRSAVRGVVGSGPTAISLPMTPDRGEWLQAVYVSKLVSASWGTAQLSDKRLFYEVIRRELGDRVDRFLPKTRGLRAFLFNAGLVAKDGRIQADGDRIEAALFREFSSGFVARPAVGVAPRETGRGLFAETDQFVQELLKKETYLYRPEHLRQPIRSSVLGDIASGEAIVLQEDVVAAARAKTGGDNSHGGVWREVRVHTYEGKVLRDATPTTWVSDVRFVEAEINSAQTFAQTFLDALPPEMLIRQAWSLDVLILENGERRIVDLVTNRGKKGGWSTYLDQPRVLGAYTRRFEDVAGVRFTGIGGMLLRHGWGHYMGYWGLRIEKSRPGIDRVLAWIPPWP